MRRAEEQRIADAWRVAAADLGIRVTAPFALPRLGGTPVEFIALVHDFGGPTGALVCAADEIERKAAAARPHGYFVSGLDPESYAAYERQHFIDTLEDWGWFGDGAPPGWYTGVSPWG